MQSRLKVEPSLYLNKQHVFETRGEVEVPLRDHNLRTRLRCVARIMFEQVVSLWWGGGGNAVVLGGRVGRCGKLNVVNGGGGVDICAQYVVRRMQGMSVNVFF